MPAFSRALRRLHVFTASLHWLLVMLTFGLVGHSDDFGFGFFFKHPIENFYNVYGLLLLFSLVI